MSNLFSISPDNLNSISVGMVAGLLIALVLSWRLFRTPVGHQRRRPKQRVTSGSSVTILSGRGASEVSSGESGVYSPLEDSRTTECGVDELLHRVKPTLAQTVRHRLNVGRKVTCQLLGVVLEQSSPEELQKQATVRSSVLEVLLEITTYCDIYLMERILDDESGEKVVCALEEAGVFTSGGLVKDKVLFCST